MKYILGSSSKIRKELFKYITNDFKVLVSTKDEIFNNDLPILKAIEQVAKDKALNIIEEHNITDEILITADTIVYQDNKIIGKPKDDNEAMNNFTSYSNNKHELITGICVYYKNKFYLDTDITTIHFSNITTEDIKYLLNKNEHLDKAGGYAIQGSMGLFVNKIEGTHLNAMGLPINKLNMLIRTIISKDN